jgi:hypothetical protein
VPGIETADARRKFGPIARRWTFWIGRHLVRRRRN